MLHRRSAIASTAIALLLISGVAQAEKVTLRNGMVLEVQIMAANDASITIKKLDGTTMRLPRTQIASIETSAPGFVELHRAEDALRKGDLKAARVLLQAALDAGGDPKRVNAALADISNREREIEMAVHGVLFRDFDAALKKNDYARAEKMLGEIDAALAPDSTLRPDLHKNRIEFYLRRAQSYRDTVDDAAAIKDLTLVRELDPSLMQVYLDLANIYIKNSKTRAEAMANFEMGLKLSNGSLPARQEARIHFELAGLYREAGRIVDSFQEYLRVHRLVPRYESRLEERIIRAALEAAAHTAEKDPAAAVAIADEALAVKADADLLDRKARYEVVLGRYDEASQTYRQVLAIDPKYRDANYNLAQLALRRLELFEARQLLDQELAFYPDNYAALCQLGELSLQRDDYDAAFGFFTRAFEVDKQELRAQIGLARSARLLKRLGVARRFVEGILAVNTNDLDANLEMGRILRDEENYEEASRYYTIVLDLLDSAGEALPAEYVRIKADALIARGEVRLLTTGPSTANADFSAALRTLPDYPAAYYNIGLAYKAKYGFSKQVGDLKEAETNLLRAQELQPKNPSYALALGILYHQVLAQVDQDNKSEYLKKASTNYNAYITLGGSDASTVSQWITECET